MKILEDFYYGNIRPYERCVKKDSEYDRMRKEWQKFHEAFTENFSEDKMKKFNAINEYSEKMHKK